jgi:hypothetical protein
MNEADYTEEYKRRLERRFPKAEDQPDPTRSKMQWNEGTQSYVRVRVDVDPYAIDRGEG